VLKRVLLLLAARLVHGAGAASYAEQVGHVVRFHLERLVAGLETLFASPEALPWASLFAFQPLLRRLGLLRGLERDVGAALSDQRIAEYAARVFEAACGAQDAPRAGLEAQALSASLRLRLRSLQRVGGLAQKTASYSSFDGLDVAHGWTAATAAAASSATPTPASPAATGAAAAAVDDDGDGDDPDEI
jgi:hypothetical protein